MKPAFLTPCEIDLSLGCRLVEDCTGFEDAELEDMAFSFDDSLLSVVGNRCKFRA